MLPSISSATYLKGYVIHLRFIDGIEGDVDFAEELEGEVFAPLNDLQYFKQFRVDAELHTLVWPNGADFAPEFLYEKIKINV
jgi:hypothetical protein